MNDKMENFMEQSRYHFIPLNIVEAKMQCLCEATIETVAFPVYSTVNVYLAAYMVSCDIGPTLLFAILFCSQNSSKMQYWGSFENFRIFATYQKQEF